MKSLTQEQPPTQVRVAWHCTCFNARRASRAVTQFYDDIMEPSDVKAPQFTMLGAVNLMGPASVTKLAEHLALDRTTLTRNLKVLVDQGLVEIGPGKDRRERVASLTEAGQDALRRATPLWHQAQGAIAEKFGVDRWRRMLEDMTELAALIEAENDS